MILIAAFIVQIIGKFRALMALNYESIVHPAFDQGHRIQQPDRRFTHVSIQFPRRDDRRLAPGAPRKPGGWWGGADIYRSDSGLPGGADQSGRSGDLER